MCSGCIRRLSASPSPNGYRSSSSTHLRVHTCWTRRASDFEMGVPPPGVPRLVTPTPGWNDEPTLAALEVLSVLPPDLRFQVGEVAARSISSVTLTLLDGRVVNWGGVEHSDRKAAVTLPSVDSTGADVRRVQSRSADGAIAPGAAVRQCAANTSVCLGAA